MVLAVQVHPSSSRPHHFRREGPEAGVYVRVGSTNRRADRELIEELRRFARGTSFDEQAMPDLDSEALDFRAASESFASVRRLKRADLDEFVALCRPPNRHQRKATWSAENPDGRWRAYEYDELMARDKASLDIFWLRDDSLADSDNLPPPGVIAQEIVDDLEAALEQFRLIAGDLAGEATE